jgi:hypothetical protein
MAMEVEILTTKLAFPIGLAPWIASIKGKIQTRILANLNVDTSEMDHYLECVEVQELPGAFLCCSFYQADMNDAFTRMGLFMGAGKGIPSGTLVAQSDPTLQNYKKLVAGHNLPGSTILEFSKAARHGSVGQELNSSEQAFLSAFLTSPAVKEKNDRFYVIGLAIQNMKTYQNVVSHEIFHAQYFLNDQYQVTVREFWGHEVEADDKHLVVETLGKAYNTTDENLIIDEFQAYLLQAEAQGDRLRNLVDKYRAQLKDKLRSNRVSVLSLD